MPRGFPILVLCAVLAGCAHDDPKPTSDTPTATVEGIAGAREGTKSAQQSVKLATPHSDAAGREILGFAVEELSAVLKHLDESLVAFGQVETNAASLYKHAIVNDEARKAAEAAGEAKLKAEQGHFWSYQQRIWWKVLVGGAVAIGAVLVLAGDFLPAGLIRSLPGKVIGGIVGLFKKSDPAAT